MPKRRKPTKAEEAARQSLVRPAAQIPQEKKGSVAEKLGFKSTAAEKESFKEDRPEPKKKPGEPAIFRDPTGRKTGIELPDGRVFLGLGQDEVTEIAEREAERARIPAGAFDIQERARGEERERAFAEQTAAPVLEQELQQKVLQTPQIEPERNLFETIFLPTTEEGERRRLETFGTTSKIPAVAAALVAGTGVGLLAQAGVAGVLAISKTVITKQALGGAAALKTATAGLAVYLVGKTGLFNFRGDEMENLRKRVQRVTEDGEKLESAVRNNFPNTDSIFLLQTMSDEVDAAEARIKDLANLNINYRHSKEWVADMALMRTARLSLSRRVAAIQNIAATGQGALNPAALLFDADQF